MGSSPVCAKPKTIKLVISALPNLVCESYFKSVIGICHLIIVEITNHTSSEPSLIKVK
jgi:hypothetical protein